MKILQKLIIILLAFNTIQGRSQGSNKITQYMSPSIGINKFGVELGLGAGIEYNDLIYTSVFHQTNLAIFYMDEKGYFLDYNVTGVDVSWNKEYRCSWYGIGLGSRAGLINMNKRQLYLEPYLFFFSTHNNRTGQSFHSIGFLAGFFTYKYTIQLGNFNHKTRQL